MITLLYPHVPMYAGWEDTAFHVSLLLGHGHDLLITSHPHRHCLESGPWGSHRGGTGNMVQLRLCFSWAYRSERHCKSKAEWVGLQRFLRGQLVLIRLSTQGVGRRSRYKWSPSTLLTWVQAGWVQVWFIKANFKHISQKKTFSHSWTTLTSTHEPWYSDAPCPTHVHNINKNVTFFFW